MKILESIKNIFSKPKVVEKREYNDNGVPLCPNCENDIWLSGPSGGMSINITCSRCNSKYNYSGPFGMEELEIKNDHKAYLRDQKIDKILGD